MDDSDAAYSIAEWKDENLNPISNRMYYYLGSIKDQIVHDTFSVDDFRRIAGDFHEQKAALAKDLTGHAA